MDDVAIKCFSLPGNVNSEYLSQRDSVIIVPSAGLTAENGIDGYRIVRTMKQCVARAGYWKDTAKYNARLCLLGCSKITVSVRIKKIVKPTLTFADDGMRIKN